MNGHNFVSMLSSHKYLPTLLAKSQMIVHCESFICKVSYRNFCYGEEIILQIALLLGVCEGMFPKDFLKH